MKKPILHDLSAGTKEWSSVEGRKFMTNNCKPILQVPSLTDEESSFNKMVRMYVNCFEFNFLIEEEERETTKITETADVDN
ncbi:10496_t:CDS:2 [Diversispora eburnea]|uniref:10496_t:CDS:1 n=1 Tax=Diversispora eburnea TaxID=1213867 RepID=A0A9N9AJS3_9GLOM|nr:10496_t:CDS:2 [Diversispora eburnea]